MNPVLQPRPLMIALSVLALGLAPTGKAWADATLYQQTLRGTVWVVAGGTDGKSLSLGSGVLIDSERKLVVTNQHIVSSKAQVLVFFPAYTDGKVVSDPNHYVENGPKLAVVGQVVRADAGRDLALIRLVQLPEGAAALPLAAASPGPGETVHAVGNSGVERGENGALAGTLWRYSRGEVRQVHRLRPPGTPFDAQVVETQIPSNPGDSGGPVVNARGQVVALTLAGRRDQALVSYGIDVDEIKALLRAADQPPGDPRVRAALNKLGIKFRVISQELFELNYTMADRSAFQVYIETRTKRLGSLELREIYAYAADSVQPFAPELTHRLLEESAQMTLGGWQVIKTPDETYRLLFCAQVPADLPPAALRDAAMTVQSTAHKLKKELAEQK